MMVDMSGVLLALQSLGACLLGYIGFRTLIAKDDLSVLQTYGHPTSFIMLFKGAGEGFLISLLNPKIAIFFLAIFSHVIQADSSLVETVFIGIIAAVIDGLWYVCVALVLIGAGIVKIFQARETTIRLVSGLILVFIAIYLLGGMLLDLT